MELISPIEAAAADSPIISVGKTQKAGTHAKMAAPVKHIQPKDSKDRLVRQD